MNTLTETQVRLFASAQCWIEGEAVRQLYATAKLDGVRHAVGFPDLHPGKGSPVGAAFVTGDVIYPHLIGGDIGCGMALFKTDLVRRDAKLDRWPELRFNLEHPWDECVDGFLAEHNLESTEFDPADYDVLHLCMNLSDSIEKHMVSNADWSIVEVLERLSFYTISDRRLGHFLELVISPLARDEAGQKSYTEHLNLLLARDGVGLRHVEDQSGYPVYRLVPITGGVAGRAKNLIFAADGPKPELVLDDAVSNDVRIVANAEYCLIYDEPIPNDGLRWNQLVNWWAGTHGFKSGDEEAGRSLYKRLAKSLASEPERLLFRAYYKRFMFLGDRLPALVPQVYLHYDPYTRQRLGGTSRLKRQRMDFLMLLSHYTRIVIEVDGKQHYSNDDHASPQKYAEMVSADRDLKLAGYDVYRFGGAELQGATSEELVFLFFSQLFQKHHRL